MNVGRLMALAEKHNITCTRAEVQAIFKKYDANFNSEIELKEFAKWWRRSDDGLSVLLRNALSVSLLQPGKCDQWQRGQNLRADVTVGAVADNFAAKSGIYVTAVPSTEADLRQACGVSSGDKKPYLHVNAKLICKDSATDDEIYEAIDIANAAVDVVASDFSRRTNEKFFQVDFKRVQLPVPLSRDPSSKVAKPKRAIDVNFKLFNVPMRGDGSDDPRVPLEEAARYAGVAKDAPLFRSIVAGVEFAADCSDIFGPMPPKALYELATQPLRVHANVELDDTLLRLVTSFMITIAKGGALRAGDIVWVALLQFLGRAPRDVHVAGNFNSPTEVLDRIKQLVSRFPYIVPAEDSDKSADLAALGKVHDPADGSDTPLDRYLRGVMAEAIRDRFETAISFLQARSTLAWGVESEFPVFRDLFGKLRSFYVLNIVGAPELDEHKEKLVKALGATPNSDKFGGRRISFRDANTPTKKTRLGVVVENDFGPILLERSRNPFERGGCHTVVLLDKCSTEAFTASLKHFQRTYFAVGRQYNNGMDNVTFLICCSKGVAAPSIPTPSALNKISEFLRSMDAALGKSGARSVFADGDSDPSDEKTEAFFSTYLGKELCDEFDGVSVPALLQAALDNPANELEGFSSSNGEVVDCTAQDAEIAARKKKLAAAAAEGKLGRDVVMFGLDAAMRTLEGVDSIDATTEYANVCVEFKNLPLGAVFSETWGNPEKLRRNRIEYIVRNAAWLEYDLGANMEVPTSFFSAAAAAAGGDQKPPAPRPRDEPKVLARVESFCEDVPVAPAAPRPVPKKVPPPAKAPVKAPAAPMGPAAPKPLARNLSDI